MKRIPQLDGLRGLAIALVLMYHYAGGVMNVVPQMVSKLLSFAVLGWVGVDLFFVLSGFLIGGILLDARDSPTYFRTFYRRRFFRIFPLYFAFLLVVAAVTQHEFAFPWLAAVTFTENLWMTLHNTMGPTTFSITWSLAIEEQFYLILPLVIYFVRGRSLKWVLGAGIVVAPLIRLVITFTHPNVATFVLLPCRMDALLLGVSTAYFIRQPGAMQWLKSHQRNLWTTIEVLTVACGLFYTHSIQDETVTRTIGYTCFDVLFACILLTALVDEKLAHALRARWLRSLGEVAYFVYLFHQIVFQFMFGGVSTSIYSWQAWALIPIAALGVTIIAAKLSWAFFENPLIQFGRKEKHSCSPTGCSSVTLYSHGRL